MAIAKKNASGKVVAKKGTAIKKSNPPKATKPNTIKKSNPKQPNALVKNNIVVVKADYEAKLAEFDAREAEKGKVIVGWGQRLNATKKKMTRLNNAYRQHLYTILQEAYAVYTEAVKHELADEFFGELRGALQEEGIKTQRNTTDAALVIRYICGAEITTKSLSDYSKVLVGAEHNHIPSTQFAEWLQQKTMTRVIDEQKSIENNVETRAERMARARRVVMRLIEARETHPILSGTTTVYEAERMITANGMWIGIGNATRRMDRENFYADINLAMFMPPDIDMEIYIINTLARYIVDDVEEYEEKITTLEEKVWADALWEQLTSAGFEESAKHNEYWANRQQASMYENQKEFIEKVVKPKKQARKK